jgi:hypothetical protein
LGEFLVYADGRSGTSTITVTVNGVVVSTKTFTFVGSLAKYVLTAANTSKVAIGVGSTGTLTRTGVDANGNTSATPTLGAATVSSNTAVATVSVSGAVATVTGVAAGTANITIYNGATVAASTISLVVPVTITKTTAAKVTISFDAPSYAAGTKATMTVSAVDANGAPVADGTYNLLGSTGISPNLALIASTLPTTASVALVGGSATYTAYVPDSSSELDLSAVQGTAVDNVIAGNTAAAITASAQLASGSADAANAATDAANAATDAANAAADSADAATQAAMDAGDKADAALAAVTALSQQVTTVLAKVAALASSLAKISAAIAKLPKK